MRHTLSALAALLVLTGPVPAQDILAPLRDLVEDLSPRRTTPPKPPAPKAEERPVVEEEPPPIPRPRPEGLGEEAASAPEREGETTPVEEKPEAAEPAKAAPEIVEPAKPAPEEAAPARIYQTACPALLSGLVIGEMIEPIAENICGERSPLLVTAVTANGRTIPLSSPVTTNCQMAGALAGWVASVDAYAKSALDTPIEEVVTGTSYMCRPRVGGGEAFTSEHGFANAVDVVGFNLGDGRMVSVKENWMPAASPEGKLLRQSHGAACGTFTTVLGPEANADHEDHLHLDLGCHGQTCTAQICE